MRVIDCNTEKEYEIGLFDSGWEHAMKIRVRECPLVFGEQGAYVGFLQTWENDEADEADEEDGISYSLDSDAVEFFELPDPFQDILDSPLEALKSIICISPRFRAAQ